MSNRFDKDLDEFISILIEELRLRLEEVEETANLSFGSEVLGVCGSNNGLENVRESYTDVYSSDVEEDGNGSEDLGGDDSDTRGAEDDKHSSESKEVVGSRDNDDSGETHDETDSNEDSIFDDSEVDDEARSLFPCPFCYMDIEVHALCVHFQEEHCLDVKNTVCPLCTGNLDRDVTWHFMVHHRSSLKWRRKLLKPGTSSSMMLGKELSLFLGYSESSRATAVPDLLPSDVLDSEDTWQDKFSDVKMLNIWDAKSSEALQNQIQKQGVEERRQTASFVQELVASTFL